MDKNDSTRGFNPRGPASQPKRTEMVSVRLPPKLRFAADIAARCQRRSLSSFVETAVAAYLPALVVMQPAAEEDEQPMKLMKLVETLWDPEPSDQFVALAENQRWLLTNDEEHLWKAIREHFAAKGPLTPDQRKSLRPIYAELKEKVAAMLKEQLYLRHSISDEARRGKRF